MNGSNDEIAIKELTAGSQNKDELVEVFAAFQREAQIMSCLDHPNLVALLGVTAAKHPMYMVMEFVPGGTLFELLHSSISDKDLDWGLRARLALDISKGMNYLHTVTPPYIHRDLRSPNILVSIK